MTLRLASGLLLWCAAVAWQRPDLRDPEWGVLLLLLAPLVLIPLGVDRLERDGTLHRPHLVRHLDLPAAVLLGVAYALPEGTLAALLAVPWCLVTVGLARAGCTRWVRQRRNVAELGACLGCMYLLVGGSCAVLDRAGARPLDLPAIVVQLTAIHFHHAGFVLPVASTFIARRFPGRLTGLAILGVCFGMLLVAAGIAVDMSDGGPWLEVPAAWFTAWSGGVVAWRHLRLARERHWPLAVRSAWAVAGVALLFGMLLVGVFGTRGLQQFGLDYGWMRALHGTANGVVFGLLGLWAWWRAPTQIVPHGPAAGRD